MEAHITLNITNMMELQLNPSTTSTMKLLDSIGVRCKSGRYVIQPSTLAYLVAKLELERLGYIVNVDPKVDEVLPKPLKEWDGAINYKTTPWKHQERATRYILANKSVFLNHSMGTGKSKSIIDAINTSHPLWTLIVAPLNVAKYTWRREFAKHNNIQDLAICDELGSKSKRIEAIRSIIAEPCSSKVVILNYESLKIPEIWEIIQSIPFNLIVLDESQKLKTPRSAISLRCHELGEYFKDTTKVCSTGTPIGGNYIDLWSQYKFLNPKVFQPYISHFKSCSFELDEWGAVCGVLPQHIPLIHRCRDLLMDTIKTDDVLNLPPKVHKEVRYTLTGESLRVYKALKKDLIVALKEVDYSVDNVLVQINALRQICSGHMPKQAGGQSIGSDKLKALSEEIDQIAQDEPLVIFHTFKQESVDIANLCKDKGITYSVLNGDADDLDTWLQGQSMVLIVQIHSGGVGLDFTRARYCIYYSSTYNYTDYVQSLARVHRPGQCKPVVYLHLIGENTIDEDIYAALDTKKDIATLLLEKVLKK